MSASKTMSLDSRENPELPSNHFLLPFGVYAFWRPSTWLAFLQPPWASWPKSATVSKSICLLALNTFPWSLRQAHDLHIFRAGVSVPCDEAVPPHAHRAWEEQF